jgi:hypothetical protein
MGKLAMAPFIPGATILHAQSLAEMGVGGAILSKKRNIKINL